jgi:DNA-binding XRE family transcriptional regulator
MKFDAQHSDQAVLKLLGERLAALRLERNLTQQQVAEQAGLGLRTLQRLELGATATQLSGFIRVCRSPQSAPSRSSNCRARSASARRAKKQQHRLRRAPGLGVSQNDSQGGALGPDDWRGVPGR